MTSKEEAFRQLNSNPFSNCPSVELNEEEMHELRKLSDQMYNLNLDNDVHLCNDKNELGLMGEYAFAKYYDLDFSYVLGEGDLGFDYKVYNQKVGATGTIDVKTTKFTDGHLLVRTDKSLDADAYFLIVKVGNEFGLVGAAYKHDLENANVKTFKRESRAIEQGDLRTVPPPERYTLVNDDK